MATNAGKSIKSGARGRSGAANNGVQRKTVRGRPGTATGRSVKKSSGRGV